MTELIKTELEQRILTLRFNRADKKNALTMEMYTACAEAIEQAVDNPEVRVLLLAGSGGVFCSGNDLQDFLNSPPSGASDSPVLRFMRALAQFPKPVVAAVNGFAIGIGSTMLLHSDLIYAGRGTRFHFPFVNLGICPEYAATYLLPRMIGHARTAELTLLGEPFDAAKALDYGLINAVLDDAEVDAHALERARKLAQQAPNAVRVTKRLLKRYSTETVLETIGIEGELFSSMLHEPEAREALTAFMGKRKPDFSRFD